MSVFPIAQLLLICLIASACQNQRSAQAVTDDVAIRKPTATEVFNLRSKCAELGHNILADNIIGSALAQDQVSHYDPRSNRCYVELDVHTADLNKEWDYDARYLYDGQTSELLVSAVKIKGHETAFIKVSPGGFDYTTALGKIQDLMEDDRKQ
jgi:hypothetical protein